MLAAVALVTGGSLAAAPAGVAYAGPGTFNVRSFGATGNGSTNGSTDGSADGDTATVAPGGAETDESFDYAQVNKIIFACDAGMGSSAMGASLLKNKAKKAGLSDIEVKNTAINQIPDDADVVVTHKDLTDRARQKLPGAEHISVDNFLGSPKYDELIEEIQTARV